MKRLFAFFLLLALFGCNAEYKTSIDDKTSIALDQVITTKVIPNQHKEKGEQLKEISEYFLNVPYQANTLIGSPTIPEELVINFNGVDCFTLLDYVHALSNSTDRRSFMQALKKTRYQNADVDFLKRKHFFSDWVYTLPQNAVDITNQLSSDSISVKKHLNLKSDGGRFIPELDIVDREIKYIPSEKVNNNTLNALETGDYIGIYSKVNGLDVSHVGIVIKKDDQVYLRNASSLAANNKVVDTLLVDYIKSRPGIVIFRPI